MLGDANSSDATAMDDADCLRISTDNQEQAVDSMTNNSCSWEQINVDCSDIKYIAQVKLFCL